MRSKNKKKKKMIVGLASLILLVGIGLTVYFVTQKPAGNNSSLNGSGKNNNEVKEPEKKVKIIDLESNSRPYAVMINNVSTVWKYQSGLNDAYIVYELLVEGGITREMALFKDADVEKIASIRSSRHYFLDYVLENDAIYVHWGWSPQAQSDIKSLGINNINGLTYEGKYFFRDNSLNISSEHRGYTKMSSLKEATSKLNYRSTTENKSLLNYSVDSIDLSKIEGVQDANNVAIKFSSGHTSKFTYDAENKVYKKTQNNTEMIDYTSKKPFTTKNIITYQVSYSGISGDNKGRQNLDNIGSGEGYFISEGKAVPITWSKSSRSAKTVYKLKDGTELKVNDGNTYIELQPKGQTLTISADAA